MRKAHFVQRYQGRNWKWLDWSTPVPLALTITIYLTLIELFPVIGWADSAIYSSFVLDDLAYKSFAELDFRPDEIAYHWARVGFLGPLKLLTDTLGPIEGRLVHNLLLIAAFTLATQAIVSKFVAELSRQRVLTTSIAVNPWTCSSVVLGGSDGPAICYAMVSLAFLVQSKSSGNEFRCFLAGLFLGLSFSAHPFVLVPYTFSLAGIVIFTHALINSRSIRLYGMKILKLLLGFATSTLMLAVLFLKFGGDGFYMNHWLNSIKIDGSHWRVPLPDNKYLDTVLLFLVGLSSLAITVFRRSRFESTTNSPRYIAFTVAIIALGPWVAVAALDLSGMVILGTRSYVNQLVMPQTLALIFSVSRTTPPKSWRVHDCSYFLVLLAAFGISFTFSSDSPMKGIERGVTKDGYRSQSELVQAVHSLVGTSRPTLVLMDVGNWDYGFYIYHGGQRDYGGVATNFAYSFSSFNKAILNEIKDISDIQTSTVFVSDSLSTSASIRQQILQTNKYDVTRDECGGHQRFSWCFFLATPLPTPPRGFTLFGKSYLDFPDLLWSSSELSFSLGSEVQSFRLQLVAPFGQYAKPHRISLAVRSSSRKLLENSELIISPGDGLMLDVEQAEPFGTVSINSLSDCVVPYEIDSNRFPDQRKLCFGIVGIWVNGEQTSLKTQMARCRRTVQLLPSDCNHRTTEANTKAG